MPGKFEKGIAVKGRDISPVMYSNALAAETVRYYEICTYLISYTFANFKATDQGMLALSATVTLGFVWPSDFKAQYQCYFQVAEAQTETWIDI